jgi:hypothetical protein
MMTLPFLVERLKRRLEIEKKYAAREAVELSQDQQLAALPAAARGRLAAPAAALRAHPGELQGTCRPPARA